MGPEELKPLAKRWDKKPTYEELEEKVKRLKEQHKVYKEWGKEFSYLKIFLQAHYPLELRDWSMKQIKLKLSETVAKEAGLKFQPKEQ